MQKGGAIAEVEVMADSARAAQQTAVRMYPDYAPTGIQWYFGTNGEKDPLFLKGWIGSPKPLLV